MLRVIRRVRPFRRAGLNLGLWPLLIVAGCRYGYDTIDLLQPGSPTESTGGSGGQAGEVGGPAPNGAGEAGAEPGSGGTTSGAAGRAGGGSAGASGSGGTAAGGSAGSSGGTSGSQGGATSAGSGGAASGAGGGGAQGGAGGTAAGTGGTSAGSGGATSGAGGATSGAGGATAGSGGASGGGAAGGSSGATGIPPLAEGYWVLDASDSGGQAWTPSTLLFTSATANGDGTYALTYRIDWFEDAGTFGILLCGEEYGVGSYDPATAHLVMDQTGGWDAPPLDRYEADYDSATDTLVGGFWNTGSPGTFTATHRLTDTLVGPLTATATSTRSSLVASNTVDSDQLTYWSSANNQVVGEVLTLTLAIPARLRGMRMLSYPYAGDAQPSRMTAHCFDAQDTEVATLDVVASTEPMWKPMTLFVDTPVSKVALEITEVLPPGSNRVVVSGVELFGLP